MKEWHERMNEKFFYEVVMVSHDLWLFLQATEVIRIGKKKRQKNVIKSMAG